MSLTTALSSAPPGAVVHLAPGSYAHVFDATVHSSWVTISGAGDRTPPTIAGAQLFGTQFLRFVSVKFTSEVWINWSVDRHIAQRADHIQILNSVFDCGSTTTTPYTEAILVRGASENVTISGDYVHNCVVGFASMPQDLFSINTSITHCTFEDLTGDAIDLGGLSGVVIDHNIIRDIADPANYYHDDGIQFFGNVQNVSITNNILANSRDQLLFIQDAKAGYASHSSVNRNILVARNLIYGAGAYAVQDQGGQNVTFVNNTMWDNHFGSMLVMQSYFTRLKPTVKLADNIIQGLVFYDAGASYENHNLLWDVRKSYSWGDNDLVNVEPSFVDPSRGDFQLERGSPGCAGADAEAARQVDRGDPTLMTDMLGKAGQAYACMGAFEVADPPIGFGALRFGPLPLI